MTLDSSAILAILFQERGFESLMDRLLAAQTRVVGAPTLAETVIVLSAKLGEGAQGMIARFLQTFDVNTVPFGDAHWKEACEAFLRFGRGRHRAGLNFGDCLSYAVARLGEQPLLFVGNDFSRTDIQSA